MWVQKISVTQTQEKEAAAVEVETIEKEIMSCAMLYALKHCLTHYNSYVIYFILCIRTKIIFAFLFFACLTHLTRVSSTLKANETKCNE